MQLNKFSTRNMKLMLFFCLSVFLVLIKAGGEHKTQEKDAEPKDGIQHSYVVDGQDADPHEWPWQVMLLLNGTLQCGGSLINDEWVLTAASCVKDNPNPFFYSVTVGAYKRLGRTAIQRTLAVKALKYHHEFYYYSNDVALLLLNETVNITNKIRPIKLPAQGSRVAIGKTCYVTGWGHFESNKALANTLQEAPLIIGSHSSCEAEGGYYVNDVTSVCAGKNSKAGCSTDTGGPLACYEGGEWILRGLASWGKRGCLATYFTVFTRVSNYITWIHIVKDQQVSYNCTFETGICLSWYQDKKDDFDWDLVQGSRHSIPPSVDHTTRKSSGWFMFMYGSFLNRWENQRARLVSKTIPASNQTCLTFWYYMNKDNVNTLRVLVKTKSKERTVWSRTGQSGNRWLRGQVTIISQNKFQGIFEGLSGERYFWRLSGSIAIDDISFVNGSCNISDSCRNQTCYNRGTPYCLDNVGYCRCYDIYRGKQCEVLSYTCTFEKENYSFWNQSANELFSYGNYWTRFQGPTPSYATGPSVDHTTKNSSGWYMYIETSSPRKYGQTARYVSKLIRATYQICLSFWYHMNGADINTLRVLISLNSLEEPPILIQRGNQGDRWRYVQVTIKSERRFKIVFEGIVGKGFKGDIAIDDISLANGTCTISESCRNQTCFNGGTPYCLDNVGQCHCSSETYGEHCEIVHHNCNFEDGTCSWYKDVPYYNAFYWERRSGPYYYISTGPSRDHTTGTRSGYYMYIDNYKEEYGRAARLNSRTLPATNQSCLSFWYHMYGKYINTLKVLVQNGNHSVTFWSRTGQSGNRWLQGQVTIASKQQFQLTIEALAGRDPKESIIAIDDITFVNGTCKISESCRTQTCRNGGHAYCLNNTGYCYCPDNSYGKHCEIVWYNCTFEKDLCSFWNLDKKNVFNWTRHQGPTSSNNTGPLVDHTTNTSSGWYIYIDTSPPRKYGDTARLASKNLPATNQTCLSFWYHMYGKDINTLSVLITNGSCNTTVWSRTGQSGNMWLKAEVFITSQNQFQIVFEGIAGRSYRGSAAIDDVTLVNRACNFSLLTTPQATAKQVWTTSDPRTTPIQQVSYNCTFEMGLCSFWHQEERYRHRFDWTRHQGSTTSYATGPSVDHTKKTSLGWYMYIETSSPTKYGQTARLISNTLPATNQTCLSFWHHMHGADINTLRVLIKKGKQQTTVWSKTGQSGDRWQKGQVTVTSKSQFEIVFEGIAGSGYKGDIAIDDILLVNGTCNISASCRDQTCYHGGTPYCSDNVGHCYCSSGAHGEHCEFAYYGCTFEDGICSWHQSLTDGFDWARKRGKASYYNSTGPSTDHTTGTRLGYYMYIYSSKHRFGKAARLISRTFHSTNNTCLSFWYHMYGYAVNMLKVLVTNGNHSVTVWSRTGQSGNRWLQGQVTLTTQEQFQVIFEAVAGNDYFAGDVAIDDITFVKGICNISESCRNQTCYNGGHSYCLNNTGYCYCSDGTSGKHCEFVSYGCTFEDGICSWHQDLTDDFDWRRSLGLYAPFINIDHTTETSLGYCMYIYSGEYRRNKAARLISHTLPATNQTCLSFWYRMYGYDVNSLRVLVVNGSHNATVWSRTGQSGDRWLQGQVTLSSQIQFKVIFEAVTDSNSHGSSVAIDDIAFVNGICNISESCRELTCHNRGHAYCLNDTGYCYCLYGFHGKHCELLSNRCTFEKDICFWTQGSKDKLDWIRRRGDYVDHTTGKRSGWYMQLETPSRRKYGDTARLVSKTFPASNQTCLSFWYRMYGADVNTLRVLVKKGNQSVTVWSRTGQSGNGWPRGQVNITSQNQFQVIFEGVSGNGYNGDIAIDDISVVNGSCYMSESCRSHACYNGGNPYCLNNIGYCYCSSGVYAGKHCEIVLYNCTFETGICSWHQDHTNSFNWTRYRGPHHPATTSPSIDHTTGTSLGYYMYIYSSKKRTNKAARLISHTVAATNQTCLSFWYHMYGYDVNSLRVLVVNGSHNVTVWSKTGQSGDRWLQGQVTLSSQKQFKVIFEAVAGSSYDEGDIAIDDITFANGTCSISESCRNQACYIGGHAYCLNNTGYCYCPYGTYGKRCEFGSRSCTFEKGLCFLWSQDNTGEFWTRFRSSAPAPYVFQYPSVDHTTGTKLGYYMHYYADSYGYGKAARLISKTLPASNQACLSFWYQMLHITNFPSYRHTLRVLLKNSKQETIVWIQSRSHGNRWLHGSVTVTNQYQFQIVFEAFSVKGLGPGSIAIDDVLLVNGACDISVRTTSRTTTKQVWNTSRPTTNQGIPTQEPSASPGDCYYLSTCYNGGTPKCYSGQQYCDCRPSYTGPYCQQKLMNCPEINCLNSGTMVCAISEHRSFCQCKAGFTGDRCQIAVSCTSVECNRSNSLASSPLVIVLVILLNFGDWNLQ